MKILFTTVSTVALVSCFGLGSAVAQTDSGQQKTGGQQTAQDQSGGGSQQDKSAGDITCAEVTALDTAQVPGMLYYISGYDEGSKGGQSGSGGSSQNDSSKAGGSASSGASGDTSGTQASGSDSGDTSSQSGGSGSAGASGGSGDASQSGDSGGANASSGSADSSQVNVVRVSGFYEIPIERTMLACGETPDKRAGDVVREQSQSNGSDSTKSGN